MSRPVDHHILPQCYLKGFVDKDEKIWTVKIFEKYKARIRSSSPAGTAYGKNYFTINHERPLGIFVEDPLVVESKRNKFFEDKLPRLWSEFESHNNYVSINNKYQIAQTIVHLKMRSRRSRSLFFGKDYIERLMHSTIGDISKDSDGKWAEIAESIGINVDYYKELLTRLYKQSIIETGDEAQFHNGYLVREPSEDGKAKKAALWRLVQGEWTILHTDDENSFVLSDSPGNSIGDKGETFNFFGRDKFNFFFPINARMTLRIGKFSSAVRFEDLSVIRHQTIGKPAVDQINAQSLNCSYSEIYGNSKAVLEDFRERILPQVPRREISVDDIYNDIVKDVATAFPSDAWK